MVIILVLSSYRYNSVSGPTEICMCVIMQNDVVCGGKSKQGACEKFVEKVRR